MRVIKLGSTSAKRRRQRTQLFKLQGGCCYYCGVEMVLPPSAPKRKKYSPNECTLEHLDDRFSERRGKHSGEYRHVAACLRCNHERSKLRCAENLEEQRRRSGRFPSTKPSP